MGEEHRRELFSNVSLLMRLLNFVKPMVVLDPSVGVGNQDLFQSEDKGAILV
jgi:hypothetical protein